MPIFPLILDLRPSYLSGGSSAHSLLLTPMGRGTVLSELVWRIGSLGDECARVLPTFDPPDGYAQRLLEAAGRDVQITPQDRLDELVHGLEPSDLLLVINPACFPADFTNLVQDLKAPLAGICARHFVSVAVEAGGARECVHVDADGRVRRIQRYYDGVTSLNTNGIFCSLVSVAAMREFDCRHIGSLSELRRTLAAREIPSSDVCLPGGAIDLNHAGALLQLTQRGVRDAVGREQRPQSESTPRMVTGQGCRIHPSARIYGHVVLHDDVTIEAGATVVGPTLVGHGSTIRTDASVAQCLLMPGTRVRSGARLRCSVVHTSHAVDESSSKPGRSAFAPTSPKPSEPSQRWSYASVKVVAESIVAALGLLVLSPLLALVALIVKLDSRGPVFFGHGREGRNGKVFRCWKFRTMSADAHAQQRLLYAKNAVDGPQFKLENDPRITRVGRWLRTTNLDELPQLFNVVKGQMSLIGPRPSPFRENQICVPWREARLSVRPGITGLWQLCRSERDAGDFHQWIHFDMLYVKHMSAWLDMKILFGTLLTLGGRWSIPARRILPIERISAARSWPRGVAVTPLMNMIPSLHSPEREPEYQVA